MKNARCLLSLLFALALLLSACSNSAAGSSAQYKVCFVAKSTNTEFWRAAFAGANAARAEYNIDLSICGPETEEDFETQNEYIDRAVADGADALVFSAISYTENAAAIDAAAEAGVRIVVIDSDVDSENVDVRIGTDNVEAGRMTAAAALDTDSEKLVVGIVNYDLGSRNGQEREQGFREEMLKDERTREIYTINVLASVVPAAEGAKALMREHPDINVLVGFNEPLAVGVAIAVDELGLEGRVRMVGFDTNVKCIDLMQTGAVSALIVQNPYAMGYLGVEAAWKLLEGTSYDPNTLLDTSTTIITKETMFFPESQRALFAFE